MCCVKAKATWALRLRVCFLSRVEHARLALRSLLRIGVVTCFWGWVSVVVGVIKRAA